jgi:hypothetical protein
MNPGLGKGCDDGADGATLRGIIGEVIPPPGGRGAGRLG